MSSKKEEKAQDAAEQIKAAALSAAKGLSQAQAELLPKMLMLMDRRKKDQVGGRRRGKQRDRCI